VSASNGREPFNTTVNKRPDSKVFNRSGGGLQPEVDPEAEPETVAVPFESFTARPFPLQLTPTLCQSVNSTCALSPLTTTTTITITTTCLLRVKACFTSSEEQKCSIFSPRVSQLH
jgi:hypothetical protein